MTAIFEGREVGGTILRVMKAMDLNLAECIDFCHNLLDNDPDDGWLSDEQIAMLRKEASDYLQLHEGQ